jgi:hypothetical protein
MKILSKENNTDFIFFKAAFDKNEKFYAKYELLLRYINKSKKSYFITLEEFNKIRFN